MSGFKLFTSNRLEKLADVLSDIFRSPLKSAFDQEIVVVQSKGMERWLSMELAYRHGICANFRFPFPNGFVHEIFRKVLSRVPEDSAFDPRILVWKVMGLLPGFLRDPVFKDVRHYVGEPSNPLMLFQLSACIADLFDQYLLFRPEMMLQWEQSERGGWQGALWRALVHNEPQHHRAVLAREFLEATDSESDSLNNLPERVAIFGISALPRFHMEIFSRISLGCDVFLFIMNPCEEYWGDIVSDWEIKRVIDRQRSEDHLPENLHLEKGNSLLSSTGALGRDFFSLIHEFELEEQGCFEDPGQETMLACIQWDILKLSERGIGQGQQKTVLCEDDSIRIHSCHSPMREIEILHDYLLHMFARDGRLLPKDVLVMAPDIEVYAPFIEAVFDHHGGEKFPYNIADRGVRRESETIETFLSMLALGDGRWTATEVLTLLESRVIRAKFSLSDADLDMIRQWVTDSGIRWGINADCRKSMGLPAFGENTWQAGIERLLLGYALDGQDERLLEGILPYDNVEGDAALVLGRFVHFCSSLFDRIRSLDQPRTLKNWAEVLTELEKEFFLGDRETESDLQLLRRALKELEDLERVWGIEGPVDFRVVQWAVTCYMEQKGYGFGFMSGGITFCSLLPMRSIPFKIVCLVGMNGDAFPRESKPQSFDFMAQHPKPGDRSRRNDDRYLFLEAILSAREKLHISYVGQSVRDNISIPPSVLVSELMDYMVQAFDGTVGKIRDQVLIQHRLQPFSSEYFKKDGLLFSYSQQNRTAAERACNRISDTPAPFVSSGLSVPDDAWKQVELPRLSAFYANPAKFFLTRRLGIYFEEKSTLLRDREYFECEGLGRYAIENKLMDAILGGKNRDDFFSAARARGDLPHGTVGQCVFDRMYKDVARFVEKTRPYIKPGLGEPIPFDITISGFTITGSMPAPDSKGFVLYRYAKLTSKDHLALWLNHLVYSMIRPAGFAERSYLIGLDAKQKGSPWVCWEYGPVKNSEHILASLLHTYREGLVRPAHFFPKASWAYAESFLGQRKSPDEALKKALEVWNGSRYDRGGAEKDNVYNECCFRSSCPLNVDFQKLALGILAPLMDTAKKV